MPKPASTSSAAPSLTDFISPEELAALVQRARDEDLGPQRLDITSACLVPPDATCRAAIRARHEGRLCGMAVLPEVIRAYDPAVKLQASLSDGQTIAPGATAGELIGPLRSVLALERVALNFLTHLSGIATFTARYVAAVAGSRAVITDTRKTIPGLRGLAKYAVVCGGGTSHRMGLYDAMLVKDNHIAHLTLAQLPAALSKAIAQARQAQPPVAFVEVEVDTLQQLQRVLTLDVDLVLLDNMTLDQLRQAVALRDQLAPRVQLEASGGVNLQTVAAIAASGVDRIAIGALTHSAPALDLGLDIA